VRINRVTGQTMAENIAALGAGTVDVVQLFEPYVSTLLAEGSAHIWYAAATRGPTSYTTFYTRRRLLRDRRDDLRRMVEPAASEPPRAAAPPPDAPSDAAGHDQR
jgi:ABC-type nitrate/sulfonate/bicarbonate transport system substrate-binding protein